MPHVAMSDGVRLYYEEAGTGVPILFVHEFAGDWREWEPQMRFFARRHCCIAYSARGYTPSDVPDDPTKYGQDRIVEDMRELLAALRIDKAHVVGVSHPVRGENVAAFVVLQPGTQVDEAGLIAFCRTHLASYKVPRHVFTIDEAAVPRTGTGKVAKPVLRRDAETRLAAAGKE